MHDGKAKHSPTNDWDTKNAVWVDARRAGVTVTQERHTEPQERPHIARYPPCTPKPMADPPPQQQRSAAGGVRPPP